MIEIKEDFFNYLPAKTISNLLYVSHFTRDEIVKKFKVIFRLSNGFTSEKQWNFILQKTTTHTCNSVFSLEGFSNHYRNTFDKEHIYNDFYQAFKINLLLFSSLNHFLNCRRSCGMDTFFHCDLCSRIETLKSNYLNLFEAIKISKDRGILGIDTSNVIDLDVFVAKTDCYFYLKETNKCRLHQVFSYTQDLFASFSSILLRIYLNVSKTIYKKHFNYIQKPFWDQIREIINNNGIFLLSYFWHETNIEFFYEFFDKFDKYNKSFFFENNKGKPEFGSYCPSVFTASLEVFFL